MLLVFTAFLGDAALPAIVLVVVIGGEDVGAAMDGVVTGKALQVLSWAGRRTPDNVVVRGAADRIDVGQGIDGAETVPGLASTDSVARPRVEIDDDAGGAVVLVVFGVVDDIERRRAVDGIVAAEALPEVHRVDVIVTPEDVGAVGPLHTLHVGNDVGRAKPVADGSRRDCSGGLAERRSHGAGRDCLRPGAQVSGNAAVAPLGCILVVVDDVEAALAVDRVGAAQTPETVVVPGVVRVVRAGERIALGPADDLLDL